MALTKKCFSISQIMKMLTSKIPLKLISFDLLLKTRLISELKQVAKELSRQIVNISEDGESVSFLRIQCS